MSNDLERQLSDALHTLTPEPPTSFRFTPSEDAVPDAEVPLHVVDLDTVRRRRRPRYGALLAAAAVVVLGGGIAFAVLAGGASDTAPATPDRSTTPPSTVRACVSDNLVISPSRPVISGNTVLANLAIDNTGTTTCTLGRLPQVTLVHGGATGTENDPAGFPAVTATADELVLGPDDRLVFTARLQSVGTCRAGESTSTEKPGLALDTRDGFELTSDLPLRGCRLEAVGLDVRTER